MLPGARMIHLLRTTSCMVLQASSCVLGVLLLASNSAGQSDRHMGQESSPALRQTISQAAKKYNIPGLAVALIEHGQLHAIEMFGVRDKKSNAPITANTVFEAGSLGEPVYAYSVLLMAADRQLNPATPLTTYLPPPYLRDLDPISSSPSTEPLFDPAFGQITAMRVMNHTSGMPDWAQNQHLRLQVAPGQKWAYSSEGYLYLQHAVEKATGETFNDLVTRSVLRPGGMLRSSFVWQEAYASEMAAGYDRSGSPVEAHRFPRPAATATLYTTIQDYARFIMHILASAPSQRAHESAVSLMLNPSIVVEGANQFSWGLGFGLEQSADDLFFFQRNNSPGFQSFVIASRKMGNAVVIFTNSGSGLDAVPDILTATIGGNHPILNSKYLHSH
jgi:CubicO group peptidase (beta-lactamase class C family)